jgi:5'-methylthioadenosine phosphorylase
LFDFTKNRERTFFGQGLVAHISIADPFCEALSSLVAESVKAVGGNVHLGGTFITVEGPRFSTRAESNTYRGWGMSIIGMTTSPEAFLAREAEMSYAVMAHVTDYDVWHISEEAVTVEMVVRILAANTALVQNAITHLTNNLEDDPHCDCQHALRDALITDPKEIPTESKERLALLVHKYLS